MSGSTFVRDGDSLRFVAPMGGVLKGTPVLIGDLLVIPNSGALQDEIFIGDVEGVHKGPAIRKAAGFAPVAGAECWFKTGDGLFYGAGATGRVLCGAFAEGAGADAGPCSILLAGMPVNVLDVNVDQTARDAIADLQSLALGKGGALVALRMPEGVPVPFAGVENLDQFVEALFSQFGHDDTEHEKSVPIIIALGASSGSSAADPDLVTAANPSLSAPIPQSGNDQAIASVAIASNGAITITTAAVETAEAVFQVNVRYRDVPSA